MLQQQKHNQFGLMNNLDIAAARLRKPLPTPISMESSCKVLLHIRAENSFNILLKLQTSGTGGFPLGSMLPKYMALPVLFCLICLFRVSKIILGHFEAW